MALSPREIIVILLSREIMDGEVCLGAGVGGIALFSALLARKLHAPNLHILGTGNDPEPEAFFEAVNDMRCYRRSESYMDFFEVFRLSERGMGFSVYSGMQIDRFGNINLHFIGDYPDRIKVIGPGVANTSFGITCSRTILYLPAQSKRTLVEAVDFISVAGFLGGENERERAGIMTHGPTVCVTPMAIFDFHPVTKAMRLKSINEGFGLEDVLNSMGFTPILPGDADITPPPTKEEIDTLRFLDKYSILRGS
ncbi:MAG: hypothetical protein SV775_11690 [Thermodesulfobacteriota bacterium]|nr:hypothetical protein [Thermodesulfobacteriota bacterium]